MLLQEMPNAVWKGIFNAADVQQDTIKHPDTVKEVNAEKNKKRREENGTSYLCVKMPRADVMRSSKRLKRQDEDSVRLWSRLESLLVPLRSV